MENKAKHVAIIMDGNGRWAVNRGKKRTEGHKKGAEALRKISECIYDKGVEVLSVYAFSTENWKRDKEEVDYLMDLFIKAFKENFMKYDLGNGDGSIFHLEIGRKWVKMGGNGYGSVFHLFFYIFSNRTFRYFE